MFCDKLPTFPLSGNSQPTMQFVKEAVFNLDSETQLEFLNPKTVIIIDKQRLLVCKQLSLENADDESFASYLSIPVEKVRYFKYKMQLFEDAYRARRRAARLAKQRKKSAKVKKTVINNSQDRFRRARDLIAQNLSINQISKILNVSERSVTRFRRRIREEKRRLKAEGKITVDPNDPDDINSFRHLKPEEKMEKAGELFSQNMNIARVAEVLRISERYDRARAVSGCIIELEPT